MSELVEVWAAGIAPATYADARQGRLSHAEIVCQARAEAMADQIIRLHPTNNQEKS